MLRPALSLNSAAGTGVPSARPLPWPGLPAQAVTAVPQLGRPPARGGDFHPVFRPAGANEVRPRRAQRRSSPGTTNLRRPGAALWPLVFALRIVVEGLTAASTPLPSPGPRRSENGVFSSAAAGRSGLLARPAGRPRTRRPRLPAGTTGRAGRGCVRTDVEAGNGATASASERTVVGRQPRELRRPTPVNRGKDDLDFWC